MGDSVVANYRVIDSVDEEGRRMNVLYAIGTLSFLIVVCLAFESKHGCDEYFVTKTAGIWHVLKGLFEVHVVLLLVIVS